MSENFNNDDFELFDSTDLIIRNEIEADKEGGKKEGLEDKQSGSVDIDFLALEEDVEPKKEDDDKDEPLEVESKSKEVEETKEDVDTGESDELVEKVESLKEIGYLYLPDDYEVESLEKAVEDSETFRNIAAVNSVFDSIPDVEIPGVGNAKELFRYIYEKGGNNIEEFKTYNNDSFDITSLEKTIEDEKTQRKVLELLYKEKGFTETKIAKLIERSENALELEEDSKEAIEELKVLKQTKQESHEKELAARKEALQKQAEETYKNFNTIVEKETEFAGYPVAKGEKTKALESLYTNVKVGTNVKTHFNYLLEDVVLKDAKLTLALSAMLNNLKRNDKTSEVYFDFSKMEARQKTKAVSDLKSTIDKLADSSRKGSSSRDVRTSNKGFAWGDVL